jgi:hypothetical protein
MKYLTKDNLIFFRGASFQYSGIEEIKRKLIEVVKVVWIDKMILSKRNIR